MAGLEVRLTSRGFARFGGAGFLAVWLCFWTVGEAFALWILVAGGWAWITGQPPGPGRAPLETGTTVLTGVFLLGWTAFWTFGGLLAWHEFFRLVWSADRLRAIGDGLEVVNRVGLFSKHRLLRRDTLRRFFRVEAHTAVQVETAEGVVPLTRLGTPAEQRELVDALNAEFNLPPSDRLPPVLPAEWREVRSAEGEPVLVKDPAARRTAARIMWLIALPLAWAALLVLRAAWTNLNFGVAAAILAVLAGLALWGAVHVTWAREEWRLEAGALVRQKRFGSRRRELFAGTALRLSNTSDSDGDRWFKLELVDAGGRVQALFQQAHDATEVRQLGRWLVARAGLALDDRATPEALAAAEAEQAEQRRLAKEWVGEWVRRLPGFSRRD